MQSAVVPRLSATWQRRGRPGRVLAAAPSASLRPPSSRSMLHASTASLIARRGAQQLGASPWPATPPLRRPPRRQSVVPQAGLWSLPPDLYGSLQTGCGIAYLLTLGFSALPILTGESLERNERRYMTPDEEESAENIRWSVMGVLSVLPFINPMAWVFAALDDDDASALYYTLAFLYALPYLANGFQLDGFALLSVGICIFHVQLERVAQTEPVEVELPSVLRRLLGGIPLALRSLGRYSSRIGDEVGGRTRSAEDARKRRPDRKFLEERSREARAELEQFDRRRRERQAQLAQQAQRDQQAAAQQQQREREKEKER